MNPVILHLPIRIISTARRREHWSKSAARTKDHRGTMRMALTGPAWPVRKLLVEEAERRVLDAMRPELRPAVIRVRFTRIHPKAAHAMDSDNLSSAHKSVRDGVIDALCACRCGNCLRGRHKACGVMPCIDDGDPRIEWLYDQSVSSTYGLRLEITERA